MKWNGRVLRNVTFASRAFRRLRLGSSPSQQGRLPLHRLSAGVDGTRARVGARFLAVRHPLFRRSLNTAVDHHRGRQRFEQRAHVGLIHDDPFQLLTWHAPTGNESWRCWRPTAASPRKARICGDSGRCLTVCVDSARASTGVQRLYTVIERTHISFCSGGRRRQRSRLRSCNPSVARPTTGIR